MRKLLLVLLLTTTLNAQERVLFIGNSYTAANSLSTMVAALASSTNPEFSLFTANPRRRDALPARAKQRNILKARQPKLGLCRTSSTKPGT